MFVDSCDNWGNKPFNFRYVGQRFEKQLLWLISPEWENRIFVLLLQQLTRKGLMSIWHVHNLFCTVNGETTLMRHFSGLSLHESYQTLGPPAAWLLYWCSGISNDAKKDTKNWISKACADCVSSHIRAEKKQDVTYFELYHDFKSGSVVLFCQACARRPKNQICLF